MPEQARIFHIARTADIAACETGQDYRCPSLDTEGFIHCCDSNQLAGVAARYYSTVDDVQLLVIDPDRLDSPLIRENTVGGAELFPHVYGPINTSSIIDVITFGIDSTERRALEGLLD